mgnify:CR=1 FL=1
MSVPVQNEIEHAGGRWLRRGVLSGRGLAPASADAMAAREWGQSLACYLFTTTIDPKWLKAPVS